MINKNTYLRTLPKRNKDAETEQKRKKSTDYEEKMMVTISENPIGLKYEN